MGTSQGARPEVLAKWRDRLARWRESGLTVAVFCRREGVHPVSLYSWRKRLAGDQQRPARTSRASAAFMPVEIVIDEPASSEPSLASECELVVGSLVCRVPRGLNDASLRRLIRLLREDAS